MARPRILVVEDETIVALDLETWLEQLGYMVAATVQSGEEAVARTLEARPDLVLMDIHLLGSLDGIEAANLIRVHSDVPIIYLTAYGNEANSERARVLNTSFILKPFEQKDLEAAIQSFLT